MIIAGPIESFFKNPKAAPSAEGDGILYHLRRDLEEIYGDESDYKGEVHHVMLAMIGMLAGIDYLSKEFRCALVHSVGLSIISDSYRKGTKFNFNVTDDHSALL